MNDCNVTGTWIDVNYILQKLDAADAWADKKYDDDLEKAIVRRVGLLARHGWRKLFKKRLTTREDAERMVNFSEDFWGSVEYNIRVRRDDMKALVKDLRNTAEAASRAGVCQLFVSKTDMKLL